MLNFLIIFLPILWILVVVIKLFGLHLTVDLIAIFLSIIALIPFTASIIIYFVNKPVVEYQISKISEKYENNKYKYDFFLNLQCKKGSFLINHLYYNASERNIYPEKSSMSSQNFQYVSSLKEGGISLTALIDTNQTPFFNNPYLVCFSSDSKWDRINSRFILDLQVDPMALGFLTIFQPNFSYRIVSSISIDLKNSGIQSGILK